MEEGEPILNDNVGKAVHGSQVGEIPISPDSVELTSSNVGRLDTSNQAIPYIAQDQKQPNDALAAQVEPLIEALPSVQEKIEAPSEISSIETNFSESPSVAPDTMIASSIALNTPGLPRFDSSSAASVETTQSSQLVLIYFYKNHLILIFIVTIPNLIFLVVVVVVAAIVGVVIVIVIAVLVIIMLISSFR